MSHECELITKGRMHSNQDMDVQLMKFDWLNTSVA